MKKHPIILSVILIFSVGSINAQNNNALIQEDLIMYDRIPFDSSHYTSGENEYSIFYRKLFFENKNISKINIKKLIIEYLLKPETAVFEDYIPYENYLYKNLTAVKYSTEDIRKQLGEYTDTIMTFDQDIEEFTETIIQNEIDTNEINGIIFYDKWIFDENKFKMFKEVTAFSPVRNYFRPDDLGKIMPLYKLVAWFVFEPYKNKKEMKNSVKRMKLFNKVTYEYYINNVELEMYRINDDIIQGLQLEECLEKQGCAYWTSHTKEKFKHLIIDDVISGKRKGFDFHTLKLLETEKCKKRIGIFTDSIYSPNIETGEFTVNIFERQLDYSEIKSFIFIENWYVDEITLRIKKEVLGVAPVRTYYKEDDYNLEKPQKIIPFVVFFN
ncbi:MAG: hypothetical protein K8R54_13865 [Bacteroidales bacterium]|nr:hypothetical protein [Bacteroidales bacterium]